MSINENGGGFGDWGGIILLFVIAAMFGWGGIGNGGVGVNNGYVLGSDFAMTERKLDSIANGMCDGFYTQAQMNNNTNMQMMQGFNGVNYNMATQHCETMREIDKTGDRIIDYLNADKMQTLRDENQALKLAASQMAQNEYLINQLRPAPIPAFTVAAPWQYGNNNCGCPYAC